jgi:hypothetical protein
VNPVDAFVAKVSIQLIDLFESANHQPFQIKFRRDARIQIDVERVVMCLKGLASAPVAFAVNIGVSTST